jgi:hypothetical protein
MERDNNSWCGVTELSESRDVSRKKLTIEPEKSQVKF